MLLMPTPRPCAFFRFRTRQRHNNRIFYPFHPRCGETVAIVRTHRFQGADVFVVQQPDGTLAHIPRWMMEETAARYSLGSQPRLPLDHLRNLRLEIDALLNFLQPDSNTEEAVNEAEVCKAASGSLRARQRTGSRAARPAEGDASFGRDASDRDHGGDGDKEQ